MIVGLGNPGRKYEGTRHNIGFLTIDEIARELDIAIDQTKFKGQYGEGFVNGEKIALLKPSTYMNLSGQSIQQIMHFYQCSVEDLLIIYDDLDLSLGQIKLRQKGGSGGHNGLKSIIEHLQTQEFRRLKMGIGRPEQGDITKHVLSSFAQEEREEVVDMVNRAVSAGLAFIQQDFLKVMNDYNSS